jgi:hypothetical protein
MPFAGEEHVINFELQTSNFKRRRQRDGGIHRGRVVAGEAGLLSSKFAG